MQLIAGSLKTKKVSIERSCIETSPIFQLSNIVAGQQKQNANNDEGEFTSIFSLSLASIYTTAKHRKYTATIYIATKHR